MATSFNFDETLRWVGWNASYSKENEVATEKVYYLPQINMSPTSRAVVKETLERAKRMASECQKVNINVTYDLAIAKLAFEIQMEEAPNFDNIFISLGPFHIELAMFSVIGKYIAESGGPYLLNECHIIEKGSLNSFLSGKGYERSKRVNQLLLALAMEVLHFRAFQLSLSEDDLSSINVLEDELVKVHQMKELKIHSLSKEAKEILERYEIFVENTLDGKFGSTAKFWMQYIQMMHLYHEFSRSVREGDLDLFIFCLPKIASYFFAFNHQNYSRWVLLYHSNLLKLNQSHPEVFNDFKNGLFSLKHTARMYSRMPIDLTLEQTINADAACQRRCIIALTNSISARQRWAESHAIRTTVISKVFEDLDLFSGEEISEDLKDHRIKEHSQELKKLMEAIESTMNPFSINITKERLFNISTGKAARPETENFLLNIAEIGTIARDDFIDECCNDPSRFVERIKRTKVQTFSTESGKYRVKTAADNKMISVL